MGLRFKTKQGNLKIVPTKEEITSGGSTGSDTPVVSPGSGEVSTGTTNSNGELLYTTSYHINHSIYDASEHTIELTILGVNQVWNTYGTVVYGNGIKLPINTTYPWNDTYLYCLVYVDQSDSRLKMKLKGMGDCTIDIQVVYSKTI